MCPFLMFLRTVVIKQDFSCNFQKTKFGNRCRRCQCYAQWNTIGFLERCGTCKYNFYNLPEVNLNQKRSNNIKHINWIKQNCSHITIDRGKIAATIIKTQQIDSGLFTGRKSRFIARNLASVRRLSTWTESCIFGLYCTTKFVSANKLQLDKGVIAFFSSI